MNTMESNQVNGNRTEWTGSRRHLTAGKIARIFGWVIAGVVLACCLALLFGLLVKWIWGATLTPLFNLPQPSYWQAVGLIILAKLIFGGVGHPHRDSNHSSSWHKKWHERFEGKDRKNHSFAEPGNPDAELDETYRDFWEKEGKKAFEDYMNKRRSTTPGQGD